MIELINCSLPEYDKNTKLAESFLSTLQIRGHSP